MLASHTRICSRIFSHCISTDSRIRVRKNIPNGVKLIRVRQAMPLVTISSSIRETLKKHEIIPDVIDDFTPATMISVSYPSKKEVTLGNTLSPKETQDVPKIQITPEAADDDSKYTLVLTDPDAPSREDPKWSEFCHWISSDIKLPSIEAIASAQSLEEASPKKGKDVVDYMGPAPPEGTGKHRYVFLLYRNGPKTGTLTGPADHRKNWGGDKPRHGARQWAKENDLTLVGANFFFAQNSKQ
ncbi:phosphatidylethanolamine-binding protein [Peziza echinospora]|nr:phosphatidylethanolamine-binding protein [Peziza echinospora]